MKRQIFKGEAKGCLAVLVVGESLVSAAAGGCRGTAFFGPAARHPPTRQQLKTGVAVAGGFSGLRRWASIGGRWADLREAGRPCCCGIGARCLLLARRPVAGGGFWWSWLGNRGGWAVLQGSWPALVSAVAAVMRKGWAPTDHREVPEGPQRSEVAEMRLKHFSPDPRSDQRKRRGMRPE